MTVAGESVKSEPMTFTTMALPPPAEEESSNAIAIVVIILILLVAVAAIGYCLWKRQIRKEKIGISTPGGIEDEENPSHDEDKNLLVCQPIVSDLPPAKLDDSSSRLQPPKGVKLVEEPKVEVEQPSTDFNSEIQLVTIRHLRKPSAGIKQPVAD